MNDKDIKKARTESLLCELLPSALAALSDTRLNALSVVQVRCSRGKYSAEVALNAPHLDAAEKRDALRQLKKAHGLIKSYCLEQSGWFRCPDFSFYFDDSLERENRLDALFAQISKEQK